MANLVWTDDFQTGGEMVAVQKDAAGLKLAEHYALNRANGTWAYRTDHPDFNLQTFTFEALVYRTGEWGRVFGQWGGSAAGVSYVLSVGWDPSSYSPPGVVLMTYGTSRSQLIGTTPVPQNQWAHIATRFNQGTGSVFLNGNLDNSLSGMQLPHDGTYNIAIAGETDNKYGFQGLVAEVRVWNRALPDAEIQANRYRILRGDEPGLIAYWRLNEPSGSIAYDAGPRGHNLTVSGSSRSTFKRYGARRVSLDLSSAGTAKGSRITWTTTEPPNTGVTVETNLSLDGGQTWQGWQACTNGDSIPGLTPGVDLAHAKLQIWEHLHTTISSAEPILHELIVELMDTQKTIRRIPAISNFRIIPVPCKIRIG